MKKKLFFPLFLSLVLTACNDRDNTTTTTTTDTTNRVDSNTTAAPPVTAEPLDSSDQDFVRKAAMGGNMEVQLGNLAGQKAANQRVKDFGTMMVNDHSAANNELTQFARTHNVILSDSLDKKMSDHMTEMQNMEGKAFDRHYMKMMTDDHQKDVSEFEKASTNAKNPDLRAWAAKTLPTLQRHLDSAKVIRKLVQ